MDGHKSKEEWVVERCSKPFESKEDAVSYMKDRKFDGMVLKLEDGSIQAVCPTYPAGYYPKAEVLEEVNTASETCC
jgi:hypothetical protein